jgi:hypothetical protein
MRKLLLSIALICLLLLACNSKTSESATTPQHDDNEARVQDPDTPQEEIDAQPTKKRQTVEEALVDVKAAVEEAKKKHPDVDLARFGLTEEILAMYLAQGGEIPEMPEMPGFLDEMLEGEDIPENLKVDL